jgi:metallo-beta-lactamase class B
MKNNSSVSILDPAFHMPQLDRTRRIWVYLPEGYDTNDKRYPVIYMQDGQNLFDNATAVGEEWYLDETMTAIQAQCIIIGIDNGGDKRQTEYNFRDSEEFGAGEGRKYIEFIVQTLKPAIDEKFRTLGGREYTHIAGSSMGGLIAFYGAMYFPETFGGAGIFSPSFWLVPDIVQEMQLLAEQNVNYEQHFYFYGALQEDEKMVKYVQDIADMLSQYPQFKIYLDLQGEGEHSERSWGQRVVEYHNWIELNLKAVSQEV